MPYHIDEENSELAFEVREGNKLVIKIKSNIFSDSLELYLIKVGDNTEPTDKNVFSSLRVLKEIENLHDTILKEINSVTSGFWELKQDSQGNEYISTKYNVLTEGGLTTYGLGEQKLGTIYDGLPIDNDTIYWEEVEGSRVLKAKGSGGGSTGLDETKLWNVLGTPGDQQIDYSHLRSAFSQFSNEFVTINTEQEITALKHFTAGLSIGSAKKKIYEKDGVLYIDSNVAITGALTMYATDGQSVSSIYDGLPIDNDTIYWETVEGSRVLKAKGSGGEAGSVQWGNISGKPTWIEDTKPTYNWYEIQGEKPFYTKEEVAAKFVTIDTEQEITALKHFTAGLSVGESKKKIYEENGVVYIDADVAVTGAMTFYASAGRSVSTIMDGVTVDEETITKGSDNILRIKNAGAGSSFDENAMWSALSGSSDNQINKSHLTTALTGYATESWVSGKNYAVKATTLAGYGITDAYTKKESDGKYPTKTGSGASGTWGIGITGNAATASKWATARTITLGSYLSGSVSLDGSANVTLNANVLGLTSQGNKTAATGNTSPASGVRLYQVYNNGYPTPYGNLLSVKGGGAGELLLSWNNANRIYYRSLRDQGDNWLGWNELAFITDNVASATKLKTARTLWGSSFDGTADVGGDMTGVGWINGGLRVDYGDDLVGLRWRGVHTVEFGGNTGYAHTSYYFRPSYSSSGFTEVSLTIQNASASNTPTFTTTHSFNAYGVGYHKYSLGVGRTAPNDGYAGGIYAGTILANDWFRSEGNTGWLNQTYSGGWYMSDSYFIRCYGEKSVYLGSGSYRNGGGGYAANNLTTASDIYSCRFMSEGISGIPAGNIRNILGWYDSAASGWQTSYIIGCVRNYNNNWGEMRLGVYQYEGSNRAAKMFISLDGANNHLYVEGNLLVTGGVTLYGSDIRYKSIIQQVKLSLLDIAKAPSFVYHWNREGMKCDRLNIGGSAQYTQTILPWAVGEKNNLLTMDYATVAYTFAVHTARHLLTYETRTDKKIKKLENRVKYLEKQLKKLGYEEVRTLDDQSV